MPTHPHDNRMDYATARRLADQLVTRFAPYCERVEIAGSLRRHRETVHDIDMVIVPQLVDDKDCFGNPVGQHSLFDPAHMELGEVKKNGSRQKQILLPEDIHVELWIVLPPAQFGLIFAIRTGPADYNHWLVTPRRYGGALPSHLTMRDGALWNGKDLVPTPEEEDFFREIGVPMTAPELRCVPRSGLDQRDPL